MLESYHDTIAAGLIKKSYSVSLASDGKIAVNHPNQVSAILVFNIYKMDNLDAPVNEVYDDLSVILTEMKGYFYSIVIAESPNSTWTGSNIFTQESKKIPQLPPVKDAKLN